MISIFHSLYQFIFHLFPLHRIPDSNGFVKMIIIVWRIFNFSWELKVFVKCFQSKSQWFNFFFSGSILFQSEVYFLLELTWTKKRIFTFFRLLFFCRFISLQKKRECHDGLVLFRFVFFFFFHLVIWTPELVQNQMKNETESERPLFWLVHGTNAKPVGKGMWYDTMKRLFDAYEMKNGKSVKHTCTHTHIHEDCKRKTMKNTTGRQHKYKTTNTICRKQFGMFPFGNILFGNMTFHELC